MMARINAKPKRNHLINAKNLSFDGNAEGYDEDVGRAK
jgi:hypothetical protein